MLLILMNRLIVLIGVIFLLTFVTSLGVEIERDVPVTNINSSNNWVTNIGILGGVNATQFDNVNGNLTINESWLNSFVSVIGDSYCLLTGCTMTGDINMTGNDIIDVGNVDATSFTGDGSGLTNLPINLSPFMFTNGTNAEPAVDFNNSDVYVDYLIAKNNVSGVYSNFSNGTFEYLNVTKDLFVSNNTIYVGNVSISSSVGEVNGKKVLRIGDDDTIVSAFGYFGDGGFLDNISFINGSVTALSFNTNGTYFGGNFSGDNFTGGNAFFDFYNWEAQLPWLNFNGTFLTFNESYLNNSILNFISNINASDLNFSSITLGGVTITNWSDVNYTTTNDTVTFTTPSVTGSYSVVLPNTFSYEITQLIVTPTNVASSDKYRFAVYEAGSGETIEADIIKHDGIWNIMKSYTLDNQISLNFTEVSPTNTFTIKIKYLKNSPN